MNFGNLKSVFALWKNLVRRRHTHILDRLVDGTAEETEKDDGDQEEGGQDDQSDPEGGTTRHRDVEVELNKNE